MDAYLMAELRLTLRRHGHNDWSVRIKTPHGPGIIHIYDNRNRLALALERRRGAHNPSWGADLLVSPDVCVYAAYFSRHAAPPDPDNYGWLAVPPRETKGLPTEAAALSTALDWLTQHPGKHRPQTRTEPA